MIRVTLTKYTAKLAHGCPASHRRTVSRLTSCPVMRLLPLASSSAVDSRFQMTKAVMFARHLRQGVSRDTRIRSGPYSSPTPHKQKTKPPPPEPTIIHPPTLPPKDSDIWNNCMLLIDKPLTWTSQDVCGKLKRTLDVKKIGHAGTLDPLATGLLIVCIGKGTKSSERLMASEKVYTGTMRLGQATPSYDAETEPSEEAPWQHLTDAALQAAATEQFTGDIMQVPPSYSAVKVGGRKSYRAARAGKPLEIAARPRHVYEFRVSRDAPGERDATYHIRCGKGTYVRSLVHDLGEAVGSKAHVTELRRQSSGAFAVTDAWDLEALVQDAERQGMPRPPKPRAARHTPAAATGDVATDGGHDVKAP